MFNRNEGKKPLLYYWLIAIVIFIVIRFALNPIAKDESVKEVSYSQFVEMINHDQVTEVSKDDQKYTFKAKVDGDEKVYETGLWQDKDLTERLLKAKEKNDKLVFSQEIETKMNPYLSLFLTSVLPLVFIWVIFYFASRSLTKTMGGRGGGDFMNFGKSNAKIYVENKTGKTFKDVAGQEEAKDSLSEIVDFLHKPGKYKEIGAKVPKGVLLVGPPGTGKTLMAKAVAGEANVPFFSISGSEFVEMFVGMGASKVRDLFKQAKEKAPCIVFIDEIDAIGKKRDVSGYSGNDEREQTLNQLLNEMDGFDATEGVVLLAATNRPEILDPALTRPGRFDRQVQVELPDLKGREDILKVHAKNIKREDDIDYEEIAKRTAGTSGADLANIVNEGALRAVREGRKKLTQEDLEESIETVIAGQQKKNAVISDDQKKIIAYHEVGHALVAAIQTQKTPVTKITIVPRTGGALGYTMTVDKDEKYIMTKQELFDEIVTFAGGRSAEELIFNTKTTGTSGADLANIVNEGALRAVREGRKKLTQEDLEESIETVIAGQQKKNAVISDDQKKIIAYHEVGHALVAAIQTQKTPVTKITIVPRTGGALGYTMTVDKDEKYIMTKQELFDEIVTFAGGRSAEELIFNTKTTGASNDIEKATAIARNMVTIYGMDDEFDFMQLEQIQGRYLGGQRAMIVSDGTGNKIDEKVAKIISQAHMRAIEILKDNLDKLHEISDFLLKEETITGEEFMAILNKKGSDQAEVELAHESKEEKNSEDSKLENEEKTEDPIEGDKNNID